MNRHPVMREGYEYSLTQSAFRDLLELRVRDIARDITALIPIGPATLRDSDNPNEISLMLIEQAHSLIEEIATEMTAR